MEDWRLSEAGAVGRRCVGVVSHSCQAVCASYVYILQSAQQCPSSSLSVVIAIPDIARPRRPPIARSPPRIPPFPTHPQVIGARGNTYRRPNRIQKPWSGCKCGVLLRVELFREM